MGSCTLLEGIPRGILYIVKGDSQGDPVHCWGGRVPRGMSYIVFVGGDSQWDPVHC